MGRGRALLYLNDNAAFDIFTKNKIIFSQYKFYY